MSLSAFLRNWITTYLGNMLGAFAGFGLRDFVGLKVELCRASCLDRLESWLRMQEKGLYKPRGSL